MDFIIKLAIFGAFLALALFLGSMLLNFGMMIIVFFFYVITYPFRKVWEIYQKNKEK